MPLDFVHLIVSGWSGFLSHLYLVCHFVHSHLSCCLCYLALFWGGGVLSLPLSSSLSVLHTSSSTAIVIPVLSHSSKSYLTGLLQDRLTFDNYPVCDLSHHTPSCCLIHLFLAQVLLTLYTQLWTAYGLKVGRVMAKQHLSLHKMNSDTCVFSANVPCLGCVPE